MTVSGRTILRQARQSHRRDSRARLIRAAASMRPSLMPRITADHSAFDSIFAQYRSAVSPPGDTAGFPSALALSRVRSGSAVLEVAPGPGFFSIELARLGDFRITGLDISQTLGGFARQNA